MRAFRPPSVRESRADRTGNRPDGKTKVPSGTAEVEYKMAFRDHRGQSLQKGDSVAFVFHPAAYDIKLTFQNRVMKVLPPRPLPLRGDM